MRSCGRVGRMWRCHRSVTEYLLNKARDRDACRVPAAHARGCGPSPALDCCFSPRCLRRATSGRSTRTAQIGVISGTVIALIAADAGGTSVARTNRHHQARRQTRHRHQDCRRSYRHCRRCRPSITSAFHLMRLASRALTASCTQTESRFPSKASTGTAPRAAPALRTRLGRR